MLEEETKDYISFLAERINVHNQGLEIYNHVEQAVYDSVIGMLQDSRALVAFLEDLLEESDTPFDEVEVDVDA